MTIAEIKEILSQEEISESTMNLILQDERKSVQKLVVSYMKRIERDTQERIRLESMYETESVFYKKGISLVAGIDEVGRGPLAGPVTVAAVSHMLFFPV